MSKIEKIGHTVHELIDPAEPWAQTLEELSDKYLPTIAARIWQTCCWPLRMGTSWKAGDHRFLVISFEPEPDTVLYVQFWSEPHEQVIVEVCSGEWSPGSIKYVRDPQREMLRTVGFEIAGEAANFRKTVSISKATDAENLARETVRILFDVFGFHGQWPLDLKSHQGERVKHVPVYHSFRPQDFAKLLAEHGNTAKAVPDVDRGPLVLLQRGTRRFRARFVGQVPDDDLFTAVILDALTKPVEAVADEALMHVNAQVPGVLVRRHEGPEVRVSMLLRLDGGVTAAWVVSAFEYFTRAVYQCERLLRPARKRKKAVVGATPQPIVH